MPESRIEGALGTVAAGAEAGVGAARENRTVVEELSRALGRLPADQREALLMVVLRGMSYEEVVEATGSTVSTAKSQVFWARHQLQAWLANEALARESVGAQEPPAAEAVDRMIAALDAATATVEAQLAELRRMRRTA